MSIKKTTEKAAYILATIIMAVLLAVSIIAAFSYGMAGNGINCLEMCVAATGMLFSAILFGCCCFTRDSTRRCDTLALVSAMLYINIFLMGIMDTLEGNGNLRVFLLLLQTGTSVCSAAVHILLWKYQCSSLPENRVRKYFSAFIYSLVGVYIFLLTVNVFTGIMFYVDESGRFAYPGMVAEIIFFFAFYAAYLIYLLPQRCSRRKKLSLANFSFFPLLCLIIEILWYKAGIIYPVSSITYIFILMATYGVFICDYIEDKNFLLMQKASIAEQKKKQTELQTSLMLSQIRPHFLYNSLTAIRHLCKTDSTEAYKALGLFSDYLHGNMDSLGEGRMTTFEKELEHIKIYLMLEQMRFGDELKVEYDIRYCDFSLPALTVQNIVENAVRHGVTMNKDGGTVIIRSEKADGGAVITVSDNGPGFDVSAPMPDGENHFGLQNVKNSLAARGCGEMEIESNPEKGTTVKIYIREERK